MPLIKHVSTLDNQTAVKFIKGEYNPITRDLRKMQAITAKVKTNVARMKLAEYGDNSHKTGAKNERPTETANQTTTRPRNGATKPNSQNRPAL